MLFIFIVVVKSTSNMSSVFRLPRHPIQSDTDRGKGSLQRAAGKWAVNVRGWLGWMRERARERRRKIGDWPLRVEVNIV